MPGPWLSRQLKMTPGLADVDGTCQWRLWSPLCHPDLSLSLVFVIKLSSAAVITFPTGKPATLAYDRGENYLEQWRVPLEKTFSCKVWRYFITTNRALFVDLSPYTKRLNQSSSESSSPQLQCSSMLSSGFIWSTETIFEIWGQRSKKRRCRALLEIAPNNISCC